MKKYVYSLLPAFASVWCCAIISSAQSVPSLINYQGQLTDSQGMPRQGTATLWFRIWDNAEGISLADLVWAERQLDVPLIEGRFNVLLGNQDNRMTPEGAENLVGNIASAFDAPERYLGIAVDSENLEDEVRPRQQLLTAPFAFRARASTRAENADLLNGRDWSALLVDRITQQPNNDPADPNAIVRGSQVGKVDEAFLADRALQADVATDSRALAGLSADDIFVDPSANEPVARTAAVANVATVATSVTPNSVGYDQLQPLGLNGDHYDSMSICGDEVTDRDWRDVVNRNCGNARFSVTLEDTSGRPVLILLQDGTFRLAPDRASGSLRIIRRDGTGDDAGGPDDGDWTVVATYDPILATGPNEETNPSQGAGSVTIVDLPGPGRHIYKVQAKVGGANGDATFFPGSTTLVALEL